MNHFQEMNHVITEYQYDMIKEYKSKLESFRIKNYGLSDADKKEMKRIYSMVTGNSVCSTCNYGLIPKVVLQWIYNYEKSIKEKEKPTHTNKTSETVTDNINVYESPKMKQPITAEPFHTDNVKPVNEPVKTVSSGTKTSETVARVQPAKVNTKSVKEINVKPKVSTDKTKSVNKTKRK